MDTKITIPVLQGASNYPTWSIHIPVALGIKDLDHCLYKSPDDEEGGDYKVPTAKENKIAVGILKLYCAQDPLEHIKHLTVAKLAWEALKEAYKPEGFTTNHLLFKQFLRIQLSDFDSMDAFVTKAKELVTDLHTKGWKFSDECILSWFLNALTDQYEGFVANISQALRKDIKAYTLNSLCNSLLDESRRLADNEGPNKVMVIRRGSAKVFQNKVNKPYKSQNQAGKPKAKNAWKSTKGAWCNHCKVATHDTTRCFYLFPDKAPQGWDSDRDPTVRGNKAFRKREENTINLVKGQGIGQKATIVAPILTSSQISTVESTPNPPTPNQVDPMDCEQPDQPDQVGLDLFGDVNMDELQHLLADYSEKQHQVCITNKNLQFQSILTDSKLANLSKRIGKIKSCNTAQLQVLNTKENSKFTANFVIDTAAEAHIISNKELFYTLNKCRTTVSWGSAKTMEITGYGTVYIQFTDTNQRILLQNCLYMPEIGINLISQGRLNNIESVFSYTSCRLMRQNTVITCGEKIGNLYYLPVRVLKYPQINITKINIPALYSLLHQRMGHINKRAIGQLLKNTILQGSQIALPTKNNSDKRSTTIRPYYSNTTEDCKCEICIQANIRNNISKETSNTTSYQYLDKISSDLCGPITPYTYDKYRYFITFLDKVTKYLEIALLKSKDEAHKAFLVFKARAENKATKNKKATKKRSIKVFSTDNGTEYVNKRFKITLDNAGIIHQTSAPYTKEQNGNAERINRTLLNKVRCLLLSSNLPQYMWGEAILTATYLYNRTPHSKLGYKTPYEAKNGEKPDITNIKVFGSLAYFKNKRPNLKKLDPRGTLGILIGYGTDCNNYKVWDTEHNRPIWTRDIHIMENCFLPLNTTTLSSNQSSNQPKALLDLSTITLNSNGSSNTNQNIRQSIESTPTRSSSYTIEEDELNLNSHTNNPQPSIVRKVKLNASNVTEADELILVITNTNKEPTTYKKALSSPDALHWLKAMKAEINELEAQYTWDIVDLPPGRTALGGRWVYKIKTNENNQIIKYKARWVVQGYNQILGIDYLETFSSTCRPESYRLIFLLALYNNWAMLQYDVKNAFVHADIDKEIYVIQPIGFTKGSPSKVCKLNKALYGLKQSPRLWYTHLKAILLELGFTVLPYDEAVFIHSTYQIILCCHVDDSIVVGPNESIIRKVMNQASNKLKIQEMGKPSTFLGIEIEYIQGKSTTLHQTKYTLNLINRFNKSHILKYTTPFEPGLKLEKSKYTANSKEINDFQQQIGALLYLALKTRPDIAFAVNQCSKFMSNPNKIHFKALDRIWGYLNCKPNLGLYYTTKDLPKLLGYSDASWGDDLIERRSSTGYIYYFGQSNPISWYCTVQKTIALSTCEAEYMALKDSGKEAIYLNNLLNCMVKRLNINITLKQPILITDSQSAQALAENPEFHRRTKHIDIMYHYIRQLVNENQIILTYCKSKENNADPFTKGVPRVQFEDFIQVLGLKAIN